jgi:hypothetical protein
MIKVIGLVIGLSIGLSAHAEILDCYTRSEPYTLFASIEHRAQAGTFVTYHGGNSKPELYFTSEQTRTDQDWAGPLTITDRTYYQVRWMVTDEIRLTIRCSGHFNEGCRSHGLHIDNGVDRKTTYIKCISR